MKDRVIVKRYAEGFVKFAQPTIDVEKIVQEAQNFRSLLRDNPEFDDFLNTPAVDQAEKLKTIETVLVGYSQEFRQFLRLLLEHGRIRKIHDIAEYIRIAYAYGNKVEALLRTTYPLDLDLLKSVKEKLEKKLNKKFNLYLELDPDLLGGVQLIVGNTIIDGSVRKRLLELKQKLSALRVV
ncbi:MAG: ATP synthase F1 subunit delta [Candidatus Omnitrophota bacterium]